MIFCKKKKKVPYFRHRFPFCQRLRKRRDDIVVADMLADMATNMATGKKNGQHGDGHVGRHGGGEGGRHGRHDQQLHIWKAQDVSLNMVYPGWIPF